MEKTLTLHASILMDIKNLLSEKYRVNPDHIRPGNFSITDEHVMQFQLSFEYSQSNPAQNISLSFELRDNSPETLYFDSLAGLKGYEKANNYHGLEGEIVKYVDNNLDE